MLSPEVDHRDTARCRLATLPGQRPRGRDEGATCHAWLQDLPMSEAAR